MGIVAIGLGRGGGVWVIPVERNSNCLIGLGECGLKSSSNGEDAADCDIAVG